MAEAKDIPPGEYELKLGATFSDGKHEKPIFHTLRYDFKPQSVAASDSESYIAFGQNGDVQIAVPTNDDGLTVYKGAQKPVKADKECLLFFDHRTGTVRLEKLSSNINVKKTRDIDPNTEQVLRHEIARLRTSKRSNRGVNFSSSASGMGTSCTLPHGDSSSSSSSSSSSESGSDSDSEDSDKEKEKELKRNESSSSANDSGSDDELTHALEREMKNSSTSTPMPRPPPSSSIFDNMDSMPSFDLGNHAPVVSEKLAVVAKSFSSQKREKDLFNDLQLSESSDDDE